MNDCVYVCSNVHCNLIIQIVVCKTAAADIIIGDNKIYTGSSLLLSTYVIQVISYIQRI